MRNITVFMVMVILIGSFFIASFLVLSKWNNPISTLGHAVGTVQSSNGNGGSIPITTLQYKTYIYGKRLLAVKDASGLNYAFQDMLGTNRLLGDDKGRLQSKFTSQPFGKPVERVGFFDAKQKYTFTGKEDDGRLMYYGARYYDQRIGRFLSTDPVISALSSYAYVKNNPLAMIDPTGKDGERVDIWWPNAPNSPPGYHSWSGWAGGSFEHPENPWTLYAFTQADSLAAHPELYPPGIHFNVIEFSEDFPEGRLFYEDGVTERGWVMRNDEGCCPNGYNTMTGEYLYGPEHGYITLDRRFEGDTENGHYYYNRDHTGEPGWHEVGIVWGLTVPNRVNRYLITFTTQEAAGVGDASAGNGLRVIPNPSSDSFKIFFTLGEKSAPRLSLYDVNGRQVRTIFGGDRMMDPGEYSQEVSGLSSGVYFLNLNNGQSSNKVTVTN